MGKINVLIWDDMQHEAETMRNLLVPIIKANCWDMNVDIRCDRYSEFQRFLENKQNAYDLLILDCLENQNNVAKIALRMLKTLNSELKVIVITGYSPDGFENLPDIYSKKKCRAVLKTLFQSETDPNRMELVIADILGLNRYHRGINKIELCPISKNDLYLKYLIELIGGETTVKELILELKDKDVLGANIDSSQFTINALGQGLSGAIVFNLELQDTNNDSIFRFIKLSQNKNSMSIELSKARREYLEIKPNYTLSYLNNTPIPFKDYHVISAELVERSISLRKKIFTDSNGDLSIKVIEELSTKCLAELYHKKRRKNTKDQIAHSILKVFNTRRIAFLNASNDELETLTGKNKIIQIIEELQKKIAVDSIFYEKNNLKNALVHGDLHSNNILVSESNKIFIIDPANMGWDHWSRDICMLIVDIFAFGIDTGTKEYFGITAIDKWTKMGTKIINNIKIGNGLINKGIVASINWLTKKENLSRIFKDFFELWEFQMSLGVEFLRVSYKNDTLPAGKRAACLLIGIEAINIARKTYEKSLGVKS